MFSILILIFIFKSVYKFNSRKKTLSKHLDWKLIKKNRNYLFSLFALAASAFDIFTDCLQSDGWTNVFSSSGKKKTSCSARSGSECRGIRRKLTHASRTSGQGTWDAGSPGLSERKLISSRARLVRARIHFTLWRDQIHLKLYEYCSIILANLYIVMWETG